MTRELRHFKSFEPHEGYPVYAASFSPTGDALLVVDGSTQAKVYDREGKELGEFVRGDMYVRDLKNTKGHVSPARRGTGPASTACLVVAAGWRGQGAAGIERAWLIALPDSLCWCSQTAGLLGGQWHPLEKTMCMTYSEDGSIR